MLRHALLLLAALVPAYALPIVIYNGSAVAPPNNTPANQGWALVTIPGGAIEAPFAGGVTLDTTAGNSIHSGYSMGFVSPPPPISLDRNISYQVAFDLRLNSESHASSDRAGLSILVLSNDLMGIEIGFWTPVSGQPGHVWAQNTGFTHGEDAAYDTTQRTTYTLGVSGNNYALTVGGSVLISGALRNYSGFGAPYTTPNLIFVGDDTSSANASSSFFAASLAAPEPGAIVLTLAGLALVIGRASRRSATR
jgi:hypothetical protein